MNEKMMRSLWLWKNCQKVVGGWMKQGFRGRAEGGISRQVEEEQIVKNFCQQPKNHRKSYKSKSHDWNYICEIKEWDIHVKKKQTNQN
jgi:hypothetical protein